MSWPDHRKLPVNVAQDLNPQYVSAVIRTDGVMIWFVMIGLHLRCRDPDTRQTRRSKRSWLVGLNHRLPGSRREIKSTGRAAAAVSRLSG